MMIKTNKSMIYFNKSNSLFIIIIIIITINYFFFHGNLERNGRELIIKGLSETLIFF